MAQSHLLKLDDLLGGVFVKYQPLLAICIGVNETLVLCNLIYWHKRPGALSGGWIYKTAKEMELETGLKRSAQTRAVKNLIKRGFIEQRRGGVPAKRIFKVNFDVIVDKLPNLLEMNKLDGVVRANQKTLSGKTITKNTQRINKDLRGRPKPYPTHTTVALKDLLGRRNYKKSSQ